jgi:hypothetical protein
MRLKKQELKKGFFLIFYGTALQHIIWSKGQTCVIFRNGWVIIAARLQKFTPIFPKRTLRNLTTLLMTLICRIKTIVHTQTLPASVENDTTTNK